MFIGKSLDISRRALLLRTGQLAIAGSAASYALDLAGINEAAAFSSDGEYKALVCVFLYGGNDHANTLIPYDSVNYGKYANIRQSVAISRNQLVNTVLRQPEDQVLPGGLQYALSPSMRRLKARFDQQKMAVLLNVGPLEAPLTRAQYESSNTRAYPRPAKLFSHNDQQATWQSSGPEGAFASGWGGRMGDLAQSANTNAMFTAINATGNAVFLSGAQTLPFKVSPEGVIEIEALKGNRLFGSSAASDALRDLISSHHQHVFEQDYSQTMLRSLQYSPFVQNALSSSAINARPADGNSLASQLSVVAKIIAARNSLGVSRQIFLVSLGGFDLHSNLLGPQEELLAQVDEAVDQFYQWTLDLGVADKVTTFTASDFGRTLTVNGNGSDHGWGSHHFIIGGGVRGGRFYGTAPAISISSDDQVGRGRLLPTTSVDEYSATLARWFGVSLSELPSIAPNIGRFARSDIGFMRA